MSAAHGIDHGGLIRTVAALLLPGLLATSCVEDPPRSIRVVMSVGPGVMVPGQVDRVEFEMTAATPAGGTCEPSVPPAGWNLSDAGDLPKIVDLLPGETYTGQVYVRVRWRRGGVGGTVVAVQGNASSLTWPASGATEVRFRLDAACLPNPCDGTQQCLDGACVHAPHIPSPIDDESTRDPDAGGCDRDAG